MKRFTWSKRNVPTRNTHDKIGTYHARECTTYPSSVVKTWNNCPDIPCIDPPRHRRSSCRPDPRILDRDLRSPSVCSDCARTPRAIRRSRDRGGSWVRRGGGYSDLRFFFRCVWAIPSKNHVPLWNRMIIQSQNLPFSNTLPRPMRIFHPPENMDTEYSTDIREKNKEKEWCVIKQRTSTR